MQCLGSLSKNGDKLQPFGLNLPKTSSRAQPVQTDVAAVARRGWAHATSAETCHGGDMWSYGEREDNRALAWFGGNELAFGGVVLCHKHCRNQVRIQVGSGPCLVEDVCHSLMVQPWLIRKSSWCS